jgi:hypothetical protein
MFKYLYKYLYNYYNFLDDPHCGDSMDIDGSLVALGSTGAHGVWVMLVNPCRGPAPLTEIQIFTNTIKYR